jgi:type IV pilus assembly protein PilM
MGLLTSAMASAGSGRLVGVVFDEHHVRGAEIVGIRRPDRAGHRLVRTGSVPLPAGAVDHGALIDPDALAEALRALWNEAGFRSRRVAIGLDARAAVIRRADLPLLSPTDLQQAAAYEIGDLLRYPLDEALVSSVELDRASDDDRGTVRVLTLGVHEETIGGLAGVVRQADLEPVGTELVQTALIASAGSSSADPAGVRVIVHVTSSATDVIVHDDDGIRFGRVITAGVDVSESSLSDQLAMELALLEGYTSGQSESPAADEAGAAPGIAMAVEGVRRTLQYYLAEVEDRPLERLVLCGPRAGVDGLLHALEESFPSAEVVRREPVTTTDDDEEDSAYDAPFSVAVAAAGGGRGLRRFDLVPAAVRAARAARVRLGIGMVAAALLCPILAADAVARQAERAEQEEQLQGIEQVVQSLESELAGYAEVRARTIEADRATDRVDELYAQDYGFTTLVRQIAESMPDDTFLISIRVDRASTGEPPTGYSGSTPAAAVSVSGVAGDLDGVGRWMQTVGEIPAVDGLWLAQTAFGSYNDTERIGAVFTIDGAVVGRADPARALEDDQ